MNLHICQQCSTEFIPGIGSLGKFCSKSCNATYYNALRKISKIPQATPLLTKHCLECNSLIPNSNKFCNQSCSAKFNNNKRYPNKIPSQKRKESKNESDFFRIGTKILYSKISYCTICNSLIKNSHRTTCSSECRSLAFQQAGRNSAATIVRRSKDEIKLYELCFNYFNSVRNNIQIVNGWDADIIIDDCKIAVLWNGIWHYKQMPHKNHSLKQVQNRDRIKINTLTRAGWKVLIYEDRYFTPATAFEDILMRALELHQD